MYRTPTSDDPICVASRIRCASPPDRVARGPLEREVPDAHVVEEAQPLVDLAQDQPGYGALRRGQLELVEPSDRAPGRHPRELVDPEAADRDRQRFGPEARPVALRARPERHVLLDLLARPVGVGLAVAALQVRDDALEGRGVGTPAAVAVPVGDVDAVAVGAVQEAVADLLGE